MSAPAWATDLTDIWIDPTTTTGFTALGGGASGLPTAGETDFYIQAGATNKTCMSKAAWTNAIKGFIYSAGTFSVGTDGAVICWGFYSAAASLATRQPSANNPGGLMVIVGSATTAYWRFNVGGSDTLAFDSWVPYVVNPDNSLHDGGAVGSPSGTESYVGIEANLPTTAGPTKGNPLAQDAVRYGRCRIDYTLGDLANGYNTFSGANGYANAELRRWGLIELTGGVYKVQGFHSFGTSGTLVDFRDSNKTLIIRDTCRHVTSGFNRFEVMNSSSVVQWTNISILSLSTASPGTFVITAGTVTWSLCQFTDMGAFTLLSSTAATDCVWRRCLAVTAPGSNLYGSTIAESAVAADASALVWNVATDPGGGSPPGKLDGMTFTKGTNAHHAIEFGTSVPTDMTLRGCTFSGFNASNGQNDSTFNFLPTSGTYTLNLVGCTGNVSVKTTGTAVVNVVQDPITTTITVKDINTGNPIENARVLLVASDGTGPLPYQESVTQITRSGSTATVSHTGHGLVTDDFALISGANEDEYNGCYQITRINDDSYSYTVAGTPNTPATGTITATGGYFNTLTNASGIVTDSRTINADQPFTGRVRKGSSAPYYVSSPISGTIDSVVGYSTTVLLIPDQ